MKLYILLKKINEDFENTADSYSYRLGKLLERMLYCLMEIKMISPQTPEFKGRESN